ncbi:unnamed protein product [Bursaphelenchus okinawaensis]|uniref:TUG ubiquitin-like domain-containing protein n=1 Tax=Bursaphelenchus okinawaensis TaxID=465554 RepID=A0A811LBB4_9BILA|nr:unnamed protein product [Bursaphelenchus okinawaensis]CAG9119875.1 unnamed protein product [Bursaphelenchus okinawaensis]
MKEVLTETCLKQGYDADIYGLLFQRKFIDLSLPFRLLGLPNNAHLDLAEKPETRNEPIRIALQTPNGRFEAEYTKDNTLLQVLENAEQIHQVHLTKFADEVSVPAVSFMHKTFKGRLALSQTTLKSIGVEGRVLFRYLVVKMSEEEKAKIQQEYELELQKKQKLEEVFQSKKLENEKRLQLQKQYEDDVLQRTEEMHLKQIETASNNVVNVASGPSNTTEFQPEVRREASVQESGENSRLCQLESVLTTVTDSLNHGRVDDVADRLLTDSGNITLNPPPPQPFEFINFRFPDQPVATIADLIRLEESQNRITDVTPPERNACIFAVADKDVNTEVDDSFFDLTVEDAKRMQKDLREQVKKSTQQSLLPSSFIENRNKKSKMKAYKNTVIRIKLTEKFILQARFNSLEPVANLFTFVNEFVGTNQFGLIAVVKLERSSKKDLIDEGLAPRSTVTVQWKVPFNESLLNLNKVKQTSEQEATEDATNWLAENLNYTPELFLVDPLSLESGNKRKDGPANVRSPNSGPSLPKWLKKF